MGLVKDYSIALDCSDPRELVTFWAGLAGGEIRFLGDDFAAVLTPWGWLSAQRVPDYQPPTWPEGTVPKQLHLDMFVDELDAAVALAVGLGAVLVEQQPDPDRWRVLLDPAGHPFCLTTVYMRR
jgi:hypothetical protein